MNPSIGRIVHYYRSDTGQGPNAAIITRVYNDGSLGLFVMPSTGTRRDDAFVASGVTIDAGNGKGRWEWPPRV